MSNYGATKRVRCPSFERCSRCSECTLGESDHGSGSETSTLLQGEECTKATPLPKTQVAALLLVFLPESVASTLIYPFIVQLVISLGVAKGNPARVGYYSGLIESCFFATEAIFVFFWARISDKIGRKPVILFGSLGLSLALACFGFSKTLFGVMASRALQGALNGNTGVVRAMLSEVTDASNRAQAFAFMPLIWAGGSTLGPLGGGMLANPAERFPRWFDTELWRNYPYLLPCLVAGSLSLTSFACTLIFIKETRVVATGILSKLTGNKSHPSYGTITQQEPVTPTYESPSPPVQSNISELINLRFIGIFINHALLSMLDHAYIALLAVFFGTPITSGGLGLDASQIGLILGVTGLIHGVVQTVVFTPLYTTFDPKKLYIFCVAVEIPWYACFPFLNMMARTHGISYPGVWILLVVQLAFLLPMYTAYSAMFMFVSCASPTPALLGATNGFAQTVFSGMGAFIPAGVTALYAMSTEYNLLGGNLVYVFMSGLGLTGVFAGMFLLPAKPGEEPAQQVSDRGIEDGA